MPLPVWPPELPQTPLIGLTEEREANSVVFQPDFGPAKMRRRGTLARRFQSTPIEINGEQLAVFNTFFFETLAHGTTEFQWQDMLDAELSGNGTARVFRFSGAKYPTWRLTIGSIADPDERWYSANLELEVLPMEPDS